MPSFEFTSPEGKKYTVAGPDGATKEQAFQILQAQIAGGTATPDVPSAPSRQRGSLAEETARQIGLTARYGLEGVTAGAGMITDPLIQAFGGAVRATTGSNYNPATLASVGKSAADAIGLPQPVGNQENLVGALTRGVAGGGAGAATAGLASNLTNGTTKSVLQMMAQAPTVQAAALGSAGLAGEAVKQSGGGELAQLGAALAGGIIAPVAGVAASSASVRNLAESAIERIRTASPEIAKRVARTLSRNPAPQSAGTQGSVGAAGTDAANQRIAAASDLPAPIPLTEGQASRSPDQLRFELEASKGAEGAPIRNRYSDQNELIQKNFDAFVDQTGAQAADVTQAGKAVDGALRNQAAREKTEVRVKYKNAETSPEAASPVQLDDAVQFLNESAPDAVVSPLLSAARARAIKLGIAAEGSDGALVPLQTTVKDAELFRRAINQATDYEPTNIRNSAILKGSIDAATEPVAGPLYREARRARETYANRYENRAVVSDLLNTKRGMNDRKVAIEDVFKHVILDSDKAEVSHVRSLLFKGGDEGKQAWKELQGQTVNWMKEEATKNVATDQRGNRIVSAAQLDKAVRKLDSDGKLDFVFGKKGAEQIRDINELTKVVMTAPPGVVNTSNTASVLLAALTEAGVNGSMFGLPVPVISGMRLIAKNVKDRKLRVKIEQSLNGPQQRRATPPAF